MRILVVTKHYPPGFTGGYERECEIVVERLRRRHDVVVVAAPSEGPTSRDDRPWVRRELGHLPASADGVLRAPAATLAALRLARRHVERPDLLYVWNGADLPQALIQHLGEAGVPVAFRVCQRWFGGLFTEDPFLRELRVSRRGLERGWTIACRALNRLPALRLSAAPRFPAAVSWISEALRATTPVPDAVEPILERVQLAVPPAAPVFAAVAREQAPGPPLIVFAGRLEWAKGPDVALRALARLRDELGVDARLALAGPDGDLGDELARLARDRGIAGAVERVGVLDPPALARLFAQAAAVIFPSVVSEGLGLTAVEAALARAPVVATATGGLPEALAPDAHAVYVSPGDDADLAAALARVLREPDATAARVARAHARALELDVDGYLDAQESFVLDAHAALTGRA